MTFEALQQAAEKKWDGYLVVTPQIARAISSTGQVPREGFEVKAILNWPAGMCTIKGTRQQVWCPEKEMWIGWTTYDGDRVLYLH